MPVYSNLAVKDKLKAIYSASVSYFICIFNDSRQTNYLKTYQTFDFFNQSLKTYLFGDRSAL